jgi:hypothetical protein
MQFSSFIYNEVEDLVFFRHFFGKILGFGARVPDFLIFNLINEHCDNILFNKINVIESGFNLPAYLIDYLDVVDRKCFTTQFPERERTLRENIFESLEIEKENFSKMLSTFFVTKWIRRNKIFLQQTFTNNKTDLLLLNAEGKTILSFSKTNGIKILISY